VGLWDKTINPLNAELNPICHLLALLRAHDILHVSRIRVNQIRESCTVYMYRDITVSSNYRCSFPVDSVMLCTQAHIPAGFHTACGTVYE